MSDKNKISLEDRGWDDMSVILDRELPQKKRKRRFLLWSFLAGGLILFAAFLMHDSKSAVVSAQGEIASLAVEPSNESETKVSHGKTLIQRKALTIDDENSEVTTEVSQSVSSVNTIPNSVKKYSNNLNSNQYIEQRVKDDVQYNTSSTLTPNLLPVQNTIDKKSNIKSIQNLIEEDKSITKILTKSLDNTESPRNEEQKHEEQRLTFSYAHLPIIDSGLNFGEKHKLDPGFLNVVVENNAINPIRMGRASRSYLYAGGLLALNPNGHGYELGIGRKFVTRNINFFLEAGFSKINYRDEASSSNLILVDLVPDQNSTATDFSEVYKPIIESAVEENQTSLYNLLSKVNSVQITAGIEKSLFQNLNVSAGLSYARLIGIENQEVNYRSTTGLFQNELNNYNVSKSDIYNSGDIRKNELSAKFGIGYKLSKRFNLSLNYSLGLTNLLSVNNLEMDNLGLEAGLQDPSRESLPSSFYRRSCQFRVSYNF